VWGVGCRWVAMVLRQLVEAAAEWFAVTRELRADLCLCIIFEHYTEDLELYETRISPMLSMYCIACALWPLYIGVHHLGATTLTGLISAFVQQIVAMCPIESFGTLLFVLMSYNTVFCVNADSIPIWSFHFNSLYKNRRVSFWALNLLLRHLHLITLH
jgi:hypothetical protein